MKRRRGRIGRGRGERERDGGELDSLGRVRRWSTNLQDLDK